MPLTYQIELSAPNHEMLQTWLPMQGPHIRLTLGSSATLNEDFETDLGNWQTSGTWGRSTSNVHNGSYSLADSPSGNYGGNQNSFCRLVNPIPLQGVGNDESANSGLSTTSGWMENTANEIHKRNPKANLDHFVERQNGL
jgi:hypothetical protein